ncbi:hypothetical protein CAPTEDRAFT_142455, partial [Capitella teleta]
VNATDNEGNTALHLAVQNGFLDVCESLVDRGADINCQKNTALHYACAGGHLESVQLLLTRKADVTVKNTHDQSPLELAIDHMHSEVVCVMLKHRRYTAVYTVFTMTSNTEC